MAEHYNDRNEKYYTQEYVNALTDTSKMFLKQATAENKALRKKVKNMRKTVKQQSKCIQRMSDKIAKLDSQQLDSNVLDFVDWRKYALDEYASHKKVFVWLNDWIAQEEFTLGYEFGYHEDISKKRKMVSFPVYDAPLATANEILRFESNFPDEALVVTEKGHAKEYKLNDDSFILARVFHDDRENLGWIPVDYVLLDCSRLNWTGKI